MGISGASKKPIGAAPNRWFRWQKPCVKVRQQTLFETFWNQRNASTAVGSCFVAWLCFKFSKTHRIAFPYVSHHLVMSLRNVNHVPGILCAFYFGMQVDDVRDEDAEDEEAQVGQCNFSQSYSSSQLGQVETGPIVGKGSLSASLGGICFPLPWLWGGRGNPFFICSRLVERHQRFRKHHPVGKWIEIWQFFVAFLSLQVLVACLDRLADQAQKSTRRHLHNSGRANLCKFIDNQSIPSRFLLRPCAPQSPCWKPSKGDDYLRDLWVDFHHRPGSTLHTWRPCHCFECFGHHRCTRWPCSLSPYRGMLSWVEWGLGGWKMAGFSRPSNNSFDLNFRKPFQISSKPFLSHWRFTSMTHKFMTTIRGFLQFSKNYFPWRLHS